MLPISTHTVKFPKMTTISASPQPKLQIAFILGTRGRRHQFLRLMRFVMFFSLVFCTSIVFFHFWEQEQDEPVNVLTVVSLMLPVSNLSQEARNYTYEEKQGDDRKQNMYTKDLKYILLWSNVDYDPFNHFGKGQKAFVSNNCSVTKCYVTRDRKLFGGDLTKFEAIAFNGRDLNSSDLPRNRSPHQRYIFFNLESAVYYPVCDTRYNGFFNWTSTYRLNSDIPYPYIMIRDDKGEIVGPKRKIQWKDMAAVGDEFADRIQNKSKAVAWFVSRCYVVSRRKVYVRALKKALRPYELTVDVYGECGNLHCPRNESSKCNYMLQNDYFFYLSMENSFDEDYVTEKLLTAVQNDVVPIVYGGADYKRFLPPGSYIDGRKQTVKQLAAMMNKLMNSPTEYSQYFKWKHHYTYHDPVTENVCAVCKALHDSEMLKDTKVYNDFRNWWSKDQC